MRAIDYAFEHRCDIFDALDAVKRAEKKHRYGRRKPWRSALPHHRKGEERNTRCYVHPPSLAPEDIEMGFLRHVPIGSKLTGTRRRPSSDRTATANLPAVN